MSLYNIMFGENPFATILLPMLGFQDRDEIPRYRDCWWDGEHIIIYTRTGNGNRPEYAAEIAKLQAMPEYVSDQDDENDNTYALFKFKLPPQYDHFSDALKPETRTTRERWDTALTALKDSG